MTQRLRSFGILLLLRLALIGCFWAISILLFLISLGRIPEFLHSFYEHGSWLIAFDRMSLRPIPADSMAIAFGSGLLGISIVQKLIFKENWLRVQFLSAKMLVWAVIFFVFGDLLAWASHRCIFDMPPSFDLAIILSYMALGIVGVSARFANGLKRLDIDLGKGEINLLYPAFVWTNVALLLVVFQIVLISIAKF